ncbi:MAG: TSUP family transporter [Arenicella sp.]
MEFILSPEMALLLFLVAILAGFLDTLAGGGGLLTVPALLLTGMPPLFALGTNKFQSSFGTGVATLNMFKAKIVNPRECLPLMAAAFVGSAVGTIAVQFIDLEHLKLIIPIVLVLICIYFIIDPQTERDETQPPMLNAKQFALGPVPAIGFYDGMFGPGTGTFFALAGVATRAQTLLRSTAFAKTMNFATNFSSFLVFLVLGQVMFLVAVVMIGGQLIGAQLGSRMLLNIPRNALRWIIVTACLVMLAKYLYQYI